MRIIKNGSSTPIFLSEDRFSPKQSSAESNLYIINKFNLNHEAKDYPHKIKGLNRGGLIDLWKGLGYKVGAEIGVAKGSFSNLMFKGIPGLKMYLVDPYTKYKDVSRHVKPHPEIEVIAHRLMEGCNAIWIKEPSEVAFSKIQDKSLDFVYIDGNHKHDYVMLDIILWSRKVRNGGMVSGHDYNTASRRSKREVRLALKNYTKQHRINPWYITDNRVQNYKSDRHASWFWIK